MDEPIPTQPKYRLIAAGFIVALYIIFAAFLVSTIYSNASDAQWTKAMVIFNAISTIATTAVGVLLGVEVQQGNVAAANANAANANRQAGERLNAIVEAHNALNRSNPIKAAAGTDQSGIRPAQDILLGAINRGQQ